LIFSQLNEYIDSSFIYYLFFSLLNVPSWAVCLCRDFASNVFRRSPTSKTRALTWTKTSQKCSKPTLAISV
jgi:hypothetical protein